MSIRPALLPQLPGQAAAGLQAILDRVLGLVVLLVTMATSSYQ